MPGGAEAKTFERMMADLAEWFMDHPTNTWKQELREASSARLEQNYRY